MSDERETPDFGAIVAIFVALVPDILLTGWVLSVAWGWFVAPVFGVPLTVGQAVGLGMFKAIAMPSPTPDMNTARAVIDAVVKRWITLLVGLAFGAIVHAVIS